MRVRRNKSMKLMTSPVTLIVRPEIRLLLGRRARVVEIARKKIVQIEAGTFDAAPVRIETSTAAAVEAACREIATSQMCLACL